MKPIRTITGKDHEHKHRHHKHSHKKEKKEEQKQNKEKFIGSLFGFGTTKPQPPKPQPPKPQPPKPQPPKPQVPAQPPKPQVPAQPSKPQVPAQPSIPISSGIKRALLIGINYIKNPSNGLNGCINDVKSIKDLLISTFGYKAENIILMSDDQSGVMEPTKQNILDQINKAVALVKSGDTLFVHYSGHGTQVISKDNDEKNNPDTPGEDDCLCPCDFNKYSWEDGFISDDILKENLVNKIPIGAKLRVFFDCCHSGSALDLEYLWKNNENFTQVSAPERQSDDILLISGCKDNQTSADSWNAQKRQAMGALTMALIKSLANTPTIKTSWKDLVLLVRHSLATDKYTQFPMLSVSNPSVSNGFVDL